MLLTGAVSIALVFRFLVLGKTKTDNARNCKIVAKEVDDPDEKHKPKGDLCYILVCFFCHSLCQSNLVCGSGSYGRGAFLNSGAISNAFSNSARDCSVFPS